ncbi:hypothetical protein [Paenibacillus fonticola]|uniref:hypothetical protein n=1 Tax=Paenibacillus fonticola TaxID=379896 RepID=UPI00036F0093|nr:hypothetical protein [Paenibacillus fonticola]
MTVLQDRIIITHIQVKSVDKDMNQKFERYRERDRWLEVPSVSVLVYPFVAVFPNLGGVYAGAYQELRNAGSLPLPNAE